MKPKHIILLFLLIIPAFSTLLRSGWYPMQDKMQYFRLYQMDKCLKDGQLPCRWVSDLGFGYGYPLFNYYPPLPFYLGMIPVWLGIGYLDSIKILFTFSIAFSVIGIILLAKNFGLPGSATVLVTTLYLYLPYRASQIYVRGSLNESFSYIFLPLIFAGIVGVIKQPAVKIWKIILILGLSGQLLSHNLILFASAPLIIMFSIITIYLSRQKLRSMLILSIPVLLSLGISAFFVLPMLLESGFVYLETLTSGYFGYLQHFSNLNQIFFSNEFGYGSSQLGAGDNLPLSIGAVLLITLVLAIIKTFGTKNIRLVSTSLFLSLGLLAYFFLMHQKSTPLWELIQPLQLLQFPWRLIIPSSLTAIIIIILSFSQNSRLKLTKFIPFIVVLVLAMHGSFFQPKNWINTTDNQLLTDNLEFSLQQTASIFDYLPKSATAPPQSPAPNTPEVINGTATIESFQKLSSVQLAKVIVNSDKARIRFPFFNFPGVMAEVNGNPVQIQNDCTNQPYCYGNVSVDIAKGLSTVAVRLNNTPIREVANILSLLSFGVFLLLCLLKKI